MRRSFKIKNMKNNRQKPKTIFGKRFDAAAYKNRAVEEIKTYEVELPSGFIFTLRRPKLKTYIAGGQMPESLLQKMLEAEKRGTQATFQSSLSADESVDLVKFQATLVAQACIVPRIVDEPNSPEEIKFGDLEDEDYTFLVAWCMAGSVEGENFDKFRQES